MRKFGFILFFLLAVNAEAQVKADFRPCVFYSPEKGGYLETNLTVEGKSLGRRLVGSKMFQSSVTVTLKVYRDSATVLTERYNLHGPTYSDSTKAPSFLDCQKYPLPDGRYRVELTLRDYSSDIRPLLIRSDIELRFPKNMLSASFIQPLESYTRTATPGPLTRNGYNLMPYNSDYYPERSRKLAFYWEVYHAAEALGQSRPMVFEWYLEKAEDSTRLPAPGAIQKQNAKAANALLASADISDLTTGQYALVTLLRDEKNLIRKKEKYYFSRVNGRADVAALMAMPEKERHRIFVGNCNNADTLQMYVECLWPIADQVDKQQVELVAAKKDNLAMKRYLVDFWQRRAADTGSAINMWSDYYRQVQQAMALFRCGKQKGYYSSQGRVFLQYGPPNARTQQPNEQNTYPYEIWQYYRITDGATGNFFTNRKFVFVNKSIGDNCYDLVHSDMRGEVNNPRWQYEVTRRNYNGIGNPDQNTPGGTQHNQFQEIYQNPR